MKMIFGWIGVILFLFFFLIQLLLIIQKKQYFKFFLSIQTLLIIGSIFWMIYAFLEQPIYWPTGINNVFVFIFNLLFLIINCYKQANSTKKNLKLIVNFRFFKF